MSLPVLAGVGLKPAHYSEIVGAPAETGFFEIHAENYMGAGGPPHRWLEAIRAEHALSIHGVGLSIGAPRPLDRAHLARLRALIDRYQPEEFSEHLAWSSHSAGFFNDLLPLPYTRETLARVAEHVAQAQDALGRRLLIENPATYLRFAQSEMRETDFLRELVARTGCGLLLDVNNVHVCAVNHDFCASAYLRDFPLEHVGEIHLAGFAESRDAEGLLLIDAHGAPVAEQVWALYEETLALGGPRPTLIEWDNDLPAWPVLRAEARRAQMRLDRASRTERADALV